MVTRRQILAASGALVVLGFNTSARAWVGERPSPSRFRRLPRLDGVVLTDPASLAPYATDAGNIVHDTPVAVLLPGSVEDIQKMVRFCREHRIRVAARGQGHTTFGQSQVEGGLVIDMASIGDIYEIDGDSANVGAGIRWNQVVPAALEYGATPPALTGYIGLSVGGTLSVGGISPTLDAGAQVDHVRELDVVTGHGELVTCSRTRHRALFDAVLAGLGQCGIITRAVLELEPAHPMTRAYTIDYSDPDAFFADFRVLLGRGELDDVYNFGIPNPAGGWIYQLTAAKHFDPAAPPDDAFLFRGLAGAPNLVASNSTYLEYALRVDVLIEFLKSINQWDGVLHPWFDVFLPDDAVERYVKEVTPTLTPEDVGPTGFLLLLPKRRQLLRRPLLEVPRRGEWVFLFDILTAAPAPGPNPDFEARMLARNRRLFEKARGVGGLRYPIGSVPFNQADWVQHYGQDWLPFVGAKLLFDPKRILTPGPGIFG